MMNVMVRAWEIARAAVVKFGGKVKEYFPQALIMAWKEAKQNGVQTHQWTNARGMKVTLVAEHITKKEWKDDWGVVHFKADNWVYVRSIKIGNMEFNSHISRSRVDGKPVVDAGERVVNGARKKILVMLPDDVHTAVWGEYDRIEAAKNARRAAREEAERKDLAVKISNGYCTRCHSYCYGDCR
ncbi:hypothetical protein EBB07_33690 [Paenibacillaceae bacterium]|nr:hypothetical protein EBB07_33690 [Paenibacillaceae bacterium]